MPRSSRLTGWVAWVLWGVVHIFFLIGFRIRMAVFLNWVWAWLTYHKKWRGGDEGASHRIDVIDLLLQDALRWSCIKCR
jgi:hypothetical protein